MSRDEKTTSKSGEPACPRVLTSASIKELAYELGADTVGITESAPVRVKDKFLAWLKEGFAGEMSYLGRYQGKRFDPLNLLPGAKSIIVVGVNYFPTLDDSARKKSPFKVAKYAWGTDYHYVIRRLLRRLRTQLRAIEPRLNGRICVDTAPFLDKYWAQKAGLGWQGKHTNLVSRQFGSWLLIGSLIIDVVVDKYDKPQTNHCGKCTACVDSCPTGAIFEPYRINATRCISYWTIESKAAKIPDEIIAKLNNWVFGCDICLDICPFNRFEKPCREKAFRRGEENDLIETGNAAGLSENEFAKKFSRSPIKRPGLSGIKRNIAASSGDHQ